MRNITTVLFDLGGVLIELGSLSEMMETSPLSEQEIWNGWTKSPSVRRFESGSCSSGEFAEDMISEFELQITPAEFLERFRRWPQGTYAGAEVLLEQLEREYQLACLSNTNQTHWESFLGHQKIMSRFTDAFLSHQTGILKPDEAAFHQVTVALAVAPECILFFDDNPGNVAAARNAGMRAECAKTPEGVISTLKTLGLAI